MSVLQLMSEDFLYWNPEEIHRCAQVSGIEDGWFNHNGECSPSFLIPLKNEEANDE